MSYKLSNYASYIDRIVVYQNITSAILYESGSSSLWASSRIKQPCPNHIVQVFSRLMLRGQVRSAVRWLTERMNDGGVLDPSQLVNDDSKRVLNVLRE